jgi:hypothetical protein
MVTPQAHKPRRKRMVKETLIGLNNGAVIGQDYTN